MNKILMCMFVLNLNVAFLQCDIDLQATLTSTANTKCAGFSQFCDYSGPSILINEINISPSQFNGNMFGQYNTPAAGEWIELFNPNWCDSIDISGYYFGSYNSQGAGVPASFGMGFVFPPNTKVPPLGFVIVRGANAPVPPTGVIDIIVNDADNRICIEGGLTTSRFWFQDFGSWFAFYDNNGVPQDAISWGNPVASDLDFRPCMPLNNPNPTVTSLPAYNEIGSGVLLGNSSIGFTFVRIPDGGPWSDNMVSEFTSIGSCNVVGGCNTVIGATSSCNGEAIINMQNGQAPFSFQWNDVLSQKTQIADSLCGGTYQVTVTDANNCVATFSVEVLNDFMEVSYAVTNPTCTNLPGSIAVTVDPNENIQYIWSSNTNITNQTTSTATNLGIGSYDITVVSEDCTLDTTLILVSPQSITDLIFETIDESCDLDNGTITISNTIGGTPAYQFNFNGLGFSSQTTFTNLNAGTYLVEVTDVNACTYSEQISINNLAGPTDFEVNVVNSTCGNANGSIVVSNVLGGSPIYQFSLNGGEFSSNATFLNLSQNTYSITIQDENGCVYTENNIILPNISGPTDFSFNSMQSICTTLNGSIEITSVVGGTSPYLYNFNDGNFTSQTSYSNLGAAVYSVEIQDANGCLYEDTVHLLANFNPSPTDFEYTFIQPICNSLNGSIEISNVIGGTSPYLYNFNETNFNSNTIYSNLDDGIYQLVIQDVNGCLYEDTIHLLPDFSPSPTNLEFEITNPNCGLQNGEIKVINVVGGTPNYVYQFNQNQSSTVNEFKNLGLGTYLISVVDQNLCTFQENVEINTVIGEERIRIPNVFTPSADKTNDLWFITGECLTDITCTIVNRWGNFIHELKSIQENWDGTANGKIVQEGVYFYVLNATFASGRQEQFHGNISVVYE